MIIDPRISLALIACAFALAIGFGIIVMVAVQNMRVKS